jgi:hypothetical protein
MKAGEEENEAVPPAGLEDEQIKVIEKLHSE